MKKGKLLAYLLVIALVVSCLPFAYVVAEPTEKPRLLVLTDIGGDPDDQQSMVRLMCYSNEFDIEGLIATSRLGHGYTVEPDLIQEIVDGYGQVYNNLVLHDSNYPTKAYLESKIKSGQPSPGTGSLGAGKDTEGSNWIISCVDTVDSRPLNIAIWGGATDLAQAIWKVKNTRSTEEFNAFVSKMRVHCIAKQDNTVDWIINNAPNIFLILNYNVDSSSAVFRGMYRGGDVTITQTAWMNTNVKTNHGALGALYPMVTNIGCMKEGDTPSWFYFLSGRLGLGDPEYPNWGSWGGRFNHSANNRWVDGTDTYGGTTDGHATVWRWRQEFQNDFAARMDWCVMPYSQANHRPVAAVNGSLIRTVAPGTVVTLDATGSTDPDGNTLSYEWMYYKEAGSYGSDLTINNSQSITANFTAPTVSTPETIHVILKVKDGGSPSLVSYKRVIVTVDPNATPPDSIITNMVVNDTANAEDWSIQQNLQAGNLQYGDRTSIITGVPSSISGCTWIRTANDSKAYVSDPIVTFTATQPVDVYVAHDDRVTTKPSWLTGWTDTGEDLLDAAPRPFSLYKKTFSEGSNISLGNNGASGSVSMYTIIVKPSEASIPIEIIIDNGDGGAVYEETGTWHNSALKGYDNTGTRFSNAVGSTAKWTPNIQNAGSYTVYVWYPYHENSATNARYVINYSGGSVNITKNQTQGAGQWTELGTFDFAQGTGGYVRLEAVTNGGNYRADAVRFVKN